MTIKYIYVSLFVVLFLSLISVVFMMIILNVIHVYQDIMDAFVADSVERKRRKTLSPFSDVSHDFVLCSSFNFVLDSAVVFFCIYNKRYLF